MAFVNLMDIVYPVGSIYMTTTNVSPSSTIGGTWTELEQNSTIAETSSSTGSYIGRKKIAAAQLPQHSHSFRLGSTESDGKVDKYWGNQASTIANAPNTTWTYIRHDYQNTNPITYFSIEDENKESTVEEVEVTSKYICRNVDYVPYSFGVHIYYRTA